MSSIILKWNDLDLSTICEDLQRANGVDAPYGGRGSADGGVFGQPRLTGKTLSFTGSIQATSAANLRTAVDAFKSALFCEPRKGKLWVYDDRYIPAVCNSFTEPDFAEGLLNYPFAFSFLALDGEIDDTFTRVESVLNPHPWGSPFTLYGSSRDAYGHSCIRIVNNGLRTPVRIGLEYSPDPPIYIERRGTNLLINPGLETTYLTQPAKYWYFHTQTSGTWQSSVHEAYEGGRSVRIMSGSNQWNLLHQFVPVGDAFSGRALIASAYVRLLSLTAGHSGVQMRVLEYDHSGTLLVTNPGSFLATPGEWTRITCPVASINASTRFLYVEVHLNGTGIVLVDALQLEEGTAASAYSDVRPAWMEWTGSFSVNDIILFDTDERRMMKNETDDISHFGGEFWELLPGINLIWISHTDLTSADLHANISFRARRP